MKMAMGHSEYRIGCTAFKRLLCIFLLSLFTLIQPLSGFSEYQEASVLKAGFFAFDGYHNIDENGARSGYGYDLIQLIGRYANVRFTYHGYDQTLSENLELLEKGEIDFLTAVKKTPEREARFDFSERNVGVVSTILTVKAGNSEILSGEYDTYNDIRIGVMKDGMREFELETFAKENGFTFEPVHFNNTNDMSLALQNGEIDALVSSSLRKRSNEWIIDSFSTSSIYVAVQKGDTETLTIINQALDRLEIDEYHWRTDLELKYHTAMQSNLPNFTKEEKNYLEQEKNSGRVFKVLVSPDRYPYSYIEDGKIIGIMPDLFNLIAHRAGIKYEILYAANRTEYFQLLETAKPDICIDLTSDHDSAEKLGYRITDGYLSAPFSWIRKNSSVGDIEKAAKLLNAYSLPEYFAYDENYHGIEYVSYASTDDCVQSVLDGVTDAYCTYTFKAEDIVLNHPSGQLISTVAQSENKFAIGVADYHDFRLTTILNTAISCIEDWEKTEIIRSHTRISVPEHSLPTLIMHDWRIQLIAVLSVFVTVLFIFVIYQQINRQHALNRIIALQNYRLDESLQSMLDILATAIEFRSSESGAHVQRTRETVLAILKKLKKLYPKEYAFSDYKMSQIANAAVLHDVGKIAVPDHILNKPGKLTNEESEIIKQHTIRGCEILNSIPDIQTEPLYQYAHDICRWHHERWDGSGYPDGLSGDDIPIWAQVAAIADVYDALTSERVYKRAYSHQKAIEMIKNGECGAFNPKVVNAFLNVSDMFSASGEANTIVNFKSLASRSLTSLMLNAFQTFFEATDMYVFVKDVDLVYRAVSPGFAKAAGIPAERLLYHTDNEVLSDRALVQRFHEEDHNLLVTGKTFVGPIEKISENNGLTSYGYTTKRVIYDNQGRTMGILGFTRDVTAQFHSMKHHEISLTYLKQLPPEMYFFICIDINNWQIVGENRHSINGDEFLSHETPDEFAHLAFERVCDRRGSAYSFYKNFSPSYLLSIADKNRSRIVMEYIRQMPGGAKKWVRDEINFLTEPMNGHLCVTVAVYDIQDKKDEEQRLIERSEKDELTGLLNRAASRQLMDQRLMDNDTSMHALFLFDLDNFKLINDTLGHPVGDRFLSKLARVLNYHFRASDLIGRIGGDEFIILMTHVNGKKHAEQKAKELTSTLGTLINAALDAAVGARSDRALDAILDRTMNPEEQPAASNNHLSARVSASVGIALFPQDGTTREELYAHADEAMYYVKKTGKNGYLFYSDIPQK